MEQLLARIQQRPGPAATVARALLRTASMGYGAGIALRNVAYDRGWRHVHKVSVPVISVGNIVAGGTGKTPLTLLLAQKLSQTQQVAILSRGYRSVAERGRAPLVLDPHHLPVASICGDEPRLLASRLPEVEVIVGSDRVASAELAVSRGAELLLLDDGMQHRRLGRDADVVLVDAANPFGGGLLPAGVAREPARALRRASLVAIRCHHRDQYAPTRQLIQQYTDAPTMGVELVVDRVIGTDHNIMDIEGLPVVLFCGIAQPHRFRDTIESLGARVVAMHSYPDHCGPSEQEMQRIAQDAKLQQAQLLLCTEKDAMRLESELKLPVPMAWVQVSMEIFIDASQWQELSLQISRISGTSRIW